MKLASLILAGAMSVTSLAHAQAPSALGAKFKAEQAVVCATIMHDVAHGLYTMDDDTQADLELSSEDRLETMLKALLLRDEWATSMKKVPKSRVAQLVRDTRAYKGEGREDLVNYCTEKGRERLDALSPEAARKRGRAAVEQLKLWRQD